MSLRAPSRAYPLYSSRPAAEIKDFRAVFLLSPDFPGRAPAGEGRRAAGGLRAGRFSLPERGSGFGSCASLRPGTAYSFYLSGRAPDFKGFPAVFFPAPHFPGRAPGYEGPEPRRLSGRPVWCAPVGLAGGRPAGAPDGVSGSRRHAVSGAATRANGAPARGGQFRASPPGARSAHRSGRSRSPGTGAAGSARAPADRRTCLPGSAPPDDVPCPRPGKHPPPSRPARR